MLHPKPAPVKMVIAHFPIPHSGAKNGLVIAVHQSYTSSLVSLRDNPVPAES
jgi:hypothetical protein